MTVNDAYTIQDELIQFVDSRFSHDNGRNDRTFIFNAGKPDGGLLSFVRNGCRSSLIPNEKSIPRA
ncbi:hypothetical protein M493_17945 [Geobacillus genomosp. 3]|uniref:Uncharacterized protein n=1 Tax=Geobacillus genomosp. 3 TaxID=1921421 RepID=S5ZHQ2_GEOG3|nr:hypothetical protein M493_17945 [Geobacillus genomosp. 3]